MTNERAMYAAILKDPENDVLRLAYADYIQEQDSAQDERAEFIRLQVEFETHPRAANIRTGNYDATDGVGGEWVRGFELHDRITKLLASHPEWKRLTCPHCSGTGGMPACEACHGTGNLLGVPALAPNNRGDMTVRVRWPVDLKRGFIDSIAPTIWRD